MFYSTAEISIMAKGHRDELRYSCGKCRNKKSSGKKLPLNLHSFVMIIFRVIKEK